MASPSFEYIRPKSKLEKLFFFLYNSVDRDGRYQMEEVKTVETEVSLQPYW